MLRDDTKSKIRNITSGTVLTGQHDNCTAIRNVLCTSFATSTTVKDDFEGKAIIKEEQVRFIEPYITQHNLWVADLPGEDRFLTRGGEARVYLDPDNKTLLSSMMEFIMQPGWNSLIASCYTILFLRIQHIL